MYNSPSPANIHRSPSFPLSTLPSPPPHPFRHHFPVLSHLEECLLLVREVLRDVLLPAVVHLLLHHITVIEEVEQTQQKTCRQHTRLSVNAYSCTNAHKCQAGTTHTCTDACTYTDTSTPIPTHRNTHTADQVRMWDISN